MNKIHIESINPDDFDIFMVYLNRHLNENGEGDNLFQPMSKTQLIMDMEWEKKFMDGFSKPYGELGWRKLWVAKMRENKVVGHVDIRSRIELNTRHRVLLGMGVDSDCRKMRIGQKLMETMINFCKEHKEIEWIDLQVLFHNSPAKNLYLKLGFEVVGNYRDMFKIDGQSYDYTSMTLNVG